MRISQIILPLGFILITALIFVVLKSQASNSRPMPSASLTNPTPAPSASSAVLGTQTKTSGCVTANSLPDPACTPGAIISGTTKDQICQPGYSKTVRNVTESEKALVFQEYGVTSHPSGTYEVDHLISLELGGSNDISNLWPEPAEPRPGFHEKDRSENYLHEQVCQGQIKLEEAQLEIRTNWLNVYQQLP